MTLKSDFTPLHVWQLYDSFYKIISLNYRFKLILLDKQTSQEVFHWINRRKKHAHTHRSGLRDKIFIIVSGKLLVPFQSSLKPLAIACQQKCNNCHLGNGKREKYLLFWQMKTFCFICWFVYGYWTWMCTFTVLCIFDIFVFRFLLSFTSCNQTSHLFTQLVKIIIKIKKWHFRIYILKW